MTTFLDKPLLTEAGQDVTLSTILLLQISQIIFLMHLSHLLVLIYELVMEKEIKKNKKGSSHSNQLMSAEEVVAVLQKDNLLSSCIGFIFKSIYR